VFVSVFLHANLQKISGSSIGVLCFIMQDGNLTKSHKGSLTLDLPVHSGEHSVTSAQVIISLQWLTDYICCKK
jgi:hypothetical protein